MPGPRSPRRGRHRRRHHRSRWPTSTAIPTTATPGSSSAAPTRRSSTGSRPPTRSAHAVDLDGEDVEARLAYARALVRLKKLDDAAFQLLQASRIEPPDARVLKELGVVFYDKRLYDKAAVWLDEGHRRRRPTTRAPATRSASRTRPGATWAPPSPPTARPCAATRRSATRASRSPTRSPAWASTRAPSPSSPRCSRSIAPTRRPRDNREILARALDEMKKHTACSARGRRSSRRRP